jgi:long-chain acyl-CoA synthetase
MFMTEMKEKLALFADKKITFGTKVHTYAQLAADIDKLVTYFVSARIQGCNILLLGNNSYDWVVLHFALIFSRNKVILLDPRSSDAHLREVFFHADADFIISEEQVTVGLMCVTYAAIAARVPLIRPALAWRRKDASMIYLSTSGTTGASKIVGLSAEHILTNLVAAAGEFDLSGPSLIVLPLAHIYGLVANLYFSIFQGNDIIIAERLTHMPQLIKTHNITQLFCVPAMAAMVADLLATKSKAALLGRQFKLMYISGAHLSSELRLRLQASDIKALSGYGCTEASPAVSFERADVREPGTVGELLPGVDVKFIDVEDGIGEILIRGKSIITSYYYSPLGDEASFLDGWFKTGDLGFMKGSSLVVSGRRKNVIVLDNGKNVSPESLEAFFKQHVPSIAELIVFEYNGKLALEIFLGQADSACARAETTRLVQAANKTLASFERINEVLYRSEPFAKTTTQKIIRTRGSEQERGGDNR